MRRIIGIAIGGTKSAVTYASYNEGKFENIIKKTISTNPNDPNEVVNGIFEKIDEIGLEFDEVSIISGGPLDISKGTIDNPPHLPGFNQFEIVRCFKDKYNKPVHFLNDADACALAEFHFGNGRGSKNMAFVTFGTGIGAGLILNSKLYTGNNGMAGEFGHVRLSENGPMGYGKIGSIEGWCAGGTIPNWANVKGTTSTKEIFIKARNGEKDAIDAVNKLSERLGEALSVLIDILNLDTIVVGGIYSRNADIMEEKVYESLKKNALTHNLSNCVIKESYLKETIDEYSSLMGAFIDESKNGFFERHSELLGIKREIECAINYLYNCYKKGGKILVCGNGGSSSDSAHIVGELMKGFMSKRPIDKEVKEKINKEFGNDEISKLLQTGIPCIDLTAQSALLTAFANDVSSELIFAQEVLGYSLYSKEDVLIGLSTSGNSKNVVNAMKVAKAIGIKTIGFTGGKDSKISEIADVTIKAPATETYLIQEYHLPIYHYICQEIEKRI